MTRYTIICSNKECTYKLGFSMNYVPDTEGKLCDLCGSSLEAKDTSTTSSNTSAALVSGVGDINKRLPGDFRDFMQSIKRGSPNSNMKDYK